MTITSFYTGIFRGPNKIPSGGSVSFSDGHDYWWSRDHHTNEIGFSGSRKVAGARIRYSFNSPKRAALVEKHLNRT